MLQVLMTKDLDLLHPNGRVHAKSEATSLAATSKQSQSLS